MAARSDHSDVDVASREREAQKGRERSAASVLTECTDKENAVQALNLYTKKTKAELEAEKRRKQKARKKRKTSKKLAASENGGSELRTADVTEASSQDDADSNMVIDGIGGKEDDMLCKWNVSISLLGMDLVIDDATFWAARAD